MNKIKEVLKNFYFSYGTKIGRSMLISCLLCAVILFLPVIVMKSELSMNGVVEMIIAIPLFSILVFLSRSLSNFVKTIIPEMGNGWKVFLSIIFFFLLAASVGFLMRDLEISISNTWQIVITIIFDFAYLSIGVFLLLADLFKKRRDDI